MRKRVWVLWARSWDAPTWDHGYARLNKVTSKKAYQQYVALMKRQFKHNEKHGFESLEGLPTYYQESTDKAALETMRDLAQPLTKGK